MAYLAWRCMVGLHDKITLSFMVVGHVSCLVDGCFGMLKRKYCRSDIFTMDQLAEVVDLSAACDVSQAVQNSSVVWYDWHNYLIGSSSLLPPSASSTILPFCHKIQALLL